MKNTKRETVYYGISKYTSVFITLITSSILARLLTPVEFGIVSVTTVFTAFFTVLADMGLGAAVIQNRKLTDQQIEDVFGLSVYLALLLGFAFALLGFLIAVFYHNNVYRKICLLLSVSVFFNALNIVPNALLMKEKRFKLVGIRLIVVSVLSGTIAVVMACFGFGYYAIVFQSVIQAALVFVWNYVTSGLKFSLRTRKSSIRLVLDFSTFQFSFNVINYFARNMDNLLIGKVMGTESLAYYDKGYRLMMYPIQNLTYVINPILHPVLADHQDDRRYIYDSYMRVVRVLSLIGLLISAVCFASSSEIIMIVFGSQWETSVPIFRVLSIAVWPQIIASSAGSIYQSTGNTRLLLKSGLIHFGVSIGLIVIGVSTGELLTTAILVAVGQYARFFIDYYFLVARNFKYRYSYFLRDFRYDVCICTVLAVIIVAVSKIMIQNILLRLVLKTAIIVSAYTGMMILTGQLVTFKSIIKGGNQSKNWT